MKKSERISAYLETLAANPGLALDPHYQGFFTCFNRGEYYEAHDVLEQLWLRTEDKNRSFFQGLIQIAGAFVHLQKQFLQPDHPKHGPRLRPAVRLFHLGLRNIEAFGPLHLGLDVAALADLCRHHASEILASDFARNPWHPKHLPQIPLSLLPKTASESE
jgi:hypothetical protein